MSDFAIQAQAINKAFSQGSLKINVLKEVNLVVKPGEMVAIVGRSGSGKSTLLHLLAGLDDPDHGSILIGDQGMDGLSPSGRARLRNKQMGFVYQFHHLLAELTALENIMVPLRLRGMSINKANKLASDMVESVDLADRASHLPAQLSGGERQRVAIARALVGNPLVVLADEPTGNLDRQNAELFFDLICRLSQEQGVAFLVVTHDETISKRMNRSLELRDGVLL